MRQPSGIALASALLLAASPLAADDARQILKDSEAKHRSRSERYTGELSVVSKDGRARRKGWRSWREGYAGDSKQLIRFVDPPEVRGVGFLSLGHPGKSPDQWLYLPSMKRERRIATQDRDASFVGTDFSYEDMEEFDESKWDVTTKGDETIDGQTCVVIEARPTERSVYERKRIALRRDILFTVRVESFGKGDKQPAKRLVLSDLSQVNGHWVARRLEMWDLVKGSRTIVNLEKIAFDEAQPAERFTLQNLNREGAED